MTDTEIVDWLEHNSNRYLLVPPSGPGDDWSLYKDDITFVGRGPTLRICLARFRERFDGLPRETHES